MVNGLVPHYYEGNLEGDVLLDGKSVSDTPLYDLAAMVGSVFQNPKSQFFNMDSDSELAFGLENQGMTRGEILRRLDDTTDRLHLKRLRGRNIFAMSGGEKQLLAFASVYAMGPKRVCSVRGRKTKNSLCFIKCIAAGNYGPGRTIF